MKTCKDGRIWGQSNKEAGNHLGQITERFYREHYPYMFVGCPNLFKRKYNVTNKSGYPFKKGNIPWNKGKTHLAKENHPLWKGGIRSNPDYDRLWQAKRRKERPELIRAYKRKYKHARRNAGTLTLQTIQTIYEDNIKKYGTLTCYLCERKIDFGKDTLEHKTPISRGGNNDYGNLGVACRNCNSRKHDKTLEEYLKWKEGEKVSEKVVPPIKAVNKADGVKKGSANTTLTTPNDVEGKVWSTGSETGSLFGKK